MSETVTHAGVVDEVKGNNVRVRIVQTPACAACKVAGHCNAAEGKEKFVDVFTSDGLRWKVGDAVTVAASQQMATQALLLAFGLPLFLLLAVLLVVVQLTGNEVLASLCGMGGLVLYYAVLWLFRRRLQRRLAFWIEDDKTIKTNNK